jgi:hypothetical protein
MGVPFDTENKKGNRSCPGKNDLCLTYARPTASVKGNGGASHFDAGSAAEKFRITEFYKIKVQ